MSKQTIATTNARVDALEAKFDARFDRLESLIAARLTPSEPAKVTAPRTAQKTTSQPKADGKVFRSAKGKEQAKADVAAVWEQAKAKAGVKRVKDLSPKQRAAVDAQVKAIWAAVPKTRTTKA